jgi:hypothetical protein
MTAGPRKQVSRTEAVGFIALGLFLARKRTTLSWEVWRFQRTPARRAIVVIAVAALAEHFLRRRP